MYWANAIILNIDTNKVQSLFTYEGCMSVEEAKEIIGNWKQNGNIQVLCGYIKEDTTDQVVYLENNINALGQVSYENEEKSHSPKM